MLRPIDRAHLLLHPNAHLPTSDILLPYISVLLPLEAVEQVLAERAVEVEFEAGGDGGEELGRAREALEVGLLGSPGGEGG